MIEETEVGGAPEVIVRGYRRRYASAPTLRQLGAAGMGGGSQLRDCTYVADHGRIGLAITEERVLIRTLGEPLNFFFPNTVLQ